MNANRIHLWVGYPDDLKDEATAQACARMLSEDERARWERFKFERHRREYLATRVVGRRALSAYAGIAPEAWRFEIGEHGKPAIARASSGLGLDGQGLGGRTDGLTFNLSNSLGLVVCAVGHGAEIGVDVEPYARAGTIEEVAQRFFSARELEQLDALNGEARRERGLTLWTLKEAYMKARGLGMALPTKLFSFVFEDGGQGNGGNRIRLEMDTELGDAPERWQFCMFDHADHRIALMVESSDTPELDVWEARPILDAPKRVQVGEIRWHSVRNP
jgi:4'-phosphopantetheinyl transferase